MRKIFFLMLFLCFLNMYTFSQNIEQTNEVQNGIVPLSMVFHNIGWNALHSLTYNYGLNFIMGGVGTWLFIETGLDWKLRNIAYENEWLSSFGIPGLYASFPITAIIPITAYITGRVKKDERLQITALALTQTLALTIGMQAVLKGITGRALPGIINEFHLTRDSRADDFSNEFNWFNMNFFDGWPSGHAANAFSAVATIAEIYHDNIPLKIGMYTYAALMGFSMAVSAHWASDVLAGALIGYAIGKTVGRSYRGVLENNENRVTFYVTGNCVGVIIRI